MKAIRTGTAMVCLLIFGVSCYWDNPPEPIPVDPSRVSFQTHIQPIFDQSCNTANCHDGTWAPDLRPGSAWRELQAGGYVNLTFPEESELYSTIEFGSMPPVGQLSAIERELILAWIRKGAFND